VLEPQSTFLFTLLIAAFAGLMCWMVMTRRALVRVLAAVVAFLVAMWVGVLGVNKYFDYYPTWGAAVSDLTGPGPSVDQISDSSLLAGSKTGKAVLTMPVNVTLAQKQGYTVQVLLKGPASGIARDGYIYLPPQYFQPAYKGYQFPVVELMHGQPGAPQDWINVAGVTATLDGLVDKGLAKPAVLVMPDVNGGERVSLQCLNVPNGPQDMTYLGTDVPNDVASLLRGHVQPPGVAWGIAGYSEGGYCAANMALHYRRSYGFAGVMSGYFAPYNAVLASGRVVNPFPNRAARLANTPTAEVRALNSGEIIPQFWLGAGTGDRQDMVSAENFVQLLGLHQATPPFDPTAGGHTMQAWRAEIPQMLIWMTTNLTQAALAPHHHHAAATPCPSQPPAGNLVARHIKKRKPHPAPSATCTTSPSPAPPAHKQTAPKRPHQH
jgi:enterochelin esterase-like enzyme